MTLIVTAATAQYFAQVSDRRLTLSNGDLWDDKTNKAIVLFCGDEAAVAFAYTGAALIGGIPTDRYMTDLLMNLKAPQLTLAEVARALEGRLTERFQMADMQRWDAPYRRLTIVGVGLGSAGQKFLYRASNFEQKAGTFREAQARFQGEWFVARQPPPRSQNQRPFILMTSGDDSAMSERVRLKLRALRKRRFFHNEPADVVASRLVDVIREAESTQPATRKTIGRDCMAVWGSRPDNIRSCYFPERSEPVTYTPNVVHPIGAVTQVKMELPPGWRVRLFG